MCTSGTFFITTKNLKNTFVAVQVYMKSYYRNTKLLHISEKSFSRSCPSYEKCSPYLQWRCNPSERLADVFILFLQQGGE